MQDLVFTAQVVEVPHNPQMSQGGAMPVPNNSPEQAPNPRQSVPSLWGHRGMIRPVCRQRAEASLGRLTRDQTGHSGGRNRPPCAPHLIGTLTHHHPSPLCPEHKLEGRKLAACYKLKSQEP